jgi:diguanylate cyclase (GGDEF)-like protein/PAS domain S-box-containing protein
MIRRMDLLFSQLPLSVIAILIVATVNVLFLRNSIDRSSIIFWLGSILFITIVRLILYKAYKKDGHRHISAFYRMNLFSMLFSSVIWGASGFFIFGPEPLNNFLVVITILGIVITGITSLASDKKHLFPFITIILIPLTIRIFLYGEQPYLTVGLYLFIFFILINLVALKVNRLIEKNLDFEESHRNMIENLTISEQRFRSIFENAPSGIFYYNKDLTIFECNEAFATIVKSPKERLINLNMNNLKDEKVIPTIKGPFEGEEISSYEGYYDAMLSGAKIWVSMTCSPLKDEKGNITGAVGIVQDRSELHQVEEEMTYMAYHDSLTGLPNRLLLKDRLGQALHHTRRHSQYGAVLFLDLDNFKNINDSLGHETGDKLLIEVSKRIKALLRNEDTVSRIGGDEFVIVLSRLRESVEASMAASSLVADKIHYSLSEPFAIENKTLYSSTSIGIVLFSREDKDIETLLKSADTAMYEAKKEGRGTTHYFNESINESMKKRLSLESHLRQAPARGELVPYFQPIIRMDEEKPVIVGAETLLRWFHPESGSISPGIFIPLAEETGLILKMGEWLIGEVCRYYRQWIDNNNFVPDYISINLSVLQLQQKDFHMIVLENLDKYAINPARIVLEITENVLVGHFERVNRNIDQLREKGVRFALDDFGTGYSSLTYLKKLSLDTIKIDRSFIMDITENRKDRTLVQAILQIARDFDFKVIAEGVEEESQNQLLREMGCRFIQGYYYSKPLSPEDFASFMQTFRT